MAKKLFESTGSVLESTTLNVIYSANTTDFVAGRKLIKNTATGKIVIATAETTAYVVDNT